MCLAFCTLYVERGATPALHLRGRGGGKGGGGRGGGGFRHKTQCAEKSGLRTCNLLGFRVYGFRV